MQGFWDFEFSPWRGTECILFVQGIAMLLLFGNLNIRRGAGGITQGPEFGY